MVTTFLYSQWQDLSHVMQRTVGNSPSITSAKVIYYSDHYSCKPYRRTHTCADIREYSLNLFCSATRLTFYH